MKNNLYRVTLKGMQCPSSGNRINGVGYVVATNAEEAYLKMVEPMNKFGFGIKKDRVLDKIELIADDHDYGDATYQLYL